MGATRRKFTLEFKVEAAHRVIDSGRSVREVAHDLSVDESLLSRWVREDRRGIESAEGSGDVPLTAAERAELLWLRRQVAEQSDIDHVVIGSGASVRPGACRAPDTRVAAAQPIRIGPI